MYLGKQVTAGVSIKTNLLKAEQFKSLF